ncbi:MAG: lipocalin family protein [Bacteroidales bacterium]|nr:lipocalin family protein [Bacteroidales bacterium]
MKKISCLLFAFSMIALMMTSCGKEETPIEFDQSLLIGKWKDGTLFERYDNDGNGATWDTADDVSEDEAQPFTWTLTNDNLVQIHIMEMGGSIPKSYYVTTLTSSTLSYHDDYGVTHTFSKVQ